MKTFKETLELIDMGFCQPSFYKRSIWLKAKSIMDNLCEMDLGVIAYDFGRGKGKYTNRGELTNIELAELYIVKYEKL